MAVLWPEQQIHFSSVFFWTSQHSLRLEQCWEGWVNISLIYYYSIKTSLARPVRRGAKRTKGRCLGNTSLTAASTLPEPDQVLWNFSNVLLWSYLVDDMNGDSRELTKTLCRRRKCRQLM